jgi:hypothetical protein
MMGFGMFSQKFIRLRIESRHPLSEPAQWGAAYSHRQYRMRGLFDRAAAFVVKGDPTDYPYYFT